MFFSSSAASHEHQISQGPPATTNHLNGPPLTCIITNIKHQIHSIELDYDLFQGKLNLLRWREVAWCRHFFCHKQGQPLKSEQQWYIFHFFSIFLSILPFRLKSIQRLSVFIHCRGGLETWPHTPLLLSLIMSEGLERFLLASSTFDCLWSLCGVHFLDPLMMFTGSNWPWA